MPNAFIVLVRTERLGGGRPMLVGYGAGFSDPIEAKAAVTEHIKPLPGDEVMDPHPMSDAAAKAWGIGVGEVKML